MTRPNDVLAEQLERTTGPDDPDWEDVLMRANAINPGHRRVKRRTAVAVAVAAGALVLSPAIGLGSQLVDWVDGVETADKQLRESHNDDVLPRYLFVRQTGARGVIDGRVRTDAIVSVEVQFTDGGTARLTPGERGSFRYKVPDGRQPQALNGRAANGDLVESVPLPPPPTTSESP